MTFTRLTDDQVDMAVDLFQDQLTDAELTLPFGRSADDEFILDCFIGDALADDSTRSAQTRYAQRCQVVTVLDAEALLRASQYNDPNQPTRKAQS